MPFHQAGRPKIAARETISSSKTPSREDGSSTAPTTAARVPLRRWGGNVYPEYRSVVSMRWIPIAVCLAALLGGVASVSAQSAPTQPPATQGATHLMLPPVPKPLLPESFAGWVAADAPKTVTDPALADAENAAALKEYDFTDAALAGYQRSGETLSLRALRFHDASGAYGAYSFYRQSGWPKEEIGSGATSNSNRVLFWLGNTMVGGDLSRTSPHVRRGAARACRPLARPRRRPGAAASHSEQPAQGFAGRADDPLRSGAGGLCGVGRSSD